MTRYHIAAFAMDGSLVGVGSWDLAKLSPKWLDVAGALIASAAQAGHAAVPFENLDHISLRLTRSRGSALATYYVDDVLAVSALLLRGEDPPSESEIVQMFVQSLRNLPRVAALGRPDSFAAAFTLRERPLHIVVPWVQEEIGDQDAGLVQELSTHVAGAFLTAPDVDVGPF